MKLVVTHGMRQWHVRQVARNGRIAYVSECYASKSNAVRAARRTSAKTGWEVVVDA